MCSSANHRPDPGILFMCKVSTEMGTNEYLNRGILNAVWETDWAESWEKSDEEDAKIDGW